MGLAIVKNILEAHRGSVGMEPVDPHGTRVVVRLPIRQE